ncbi:MAG: thermonuclease family protein [Actinomycetota bacterium]|nr:thermonuclease family protein [Actinomycetota bacterium]
MRTSAIAATTLLTAAPLTAGCGNDAPVVAAPGVGTVEFVVDGDTIDVIVDGTEERVRLLGIDTPETHVDDGPPECYGPEAAAFTTSLLPVGTTVRLERDIVGRDDYGRLLAYVYRADDGLLVNEELLRQGYAQPLTIEPNGILADRFVAAAVAAEAAGVGLWAACAG